LPAGSRSQASYQSHGCCAGSRSNARALQSRDLRIQVGALEIDLWGVLARDRPVGEVQRERGFALRRLEARVAIAAHDQPQPEQLVEGDGAGEIHGGDGDLVETHARR
jgi:hypothetical protein